MHVCGYIYCTVVPEALRFCDQKNHSITVWEHLFQIKSYIGKMYGKFFTPLIIFERSGSPESNDFRAVVAFGESPPSKIIRCKKPAVTFGRPYFGNSTEVSSTVRFRFIKSRYIIIIGLVFR